ncbi:hypothetical protein R9X47_00370 [Wukongibacter baidiensis]
MGSSANRKNRLRIWPAILCAVIYIILNEIFDIPNLYDLFRRLL